MQTASGQKLVLIEIPEPAAGTQPATVDARAALRLRKVLAKSEAERAELWRQVCSGWRNHSHSAAAVFLCNPDPCSMLRVCHPQLAQCRCLLTFSAGAGAQAAAASVSRGAVQHREEEVHHGAEAQQLGSYATAERRAWHALPKPAHGMSNCAPLLAVGRHMAHHA